MYQREDRRVSSEKRWGEEKNKRELRNYKMRERRREKTKGAKKRMNFQVKAKNFHILPYGKQI